MSFKGRTRHGVGAATRQPVVLPPERNQVMARARHSYGLTHGYGSEDEVDHGISHESRGHGVSQAWIEKRVTSGVKKASRHRAEQFTHRQSAKARTATNRAGDLVVKSGDSHGPGVMAAHKSARKSMIAAGTAHQVLSAKKKKKR